MFLSRMKQIKEFVRPLLDIEARRRRLAALNYRREDDFKQIPAWVIYRHL